MQSRLSIALRVAQKLCPTAKYAHFIHHQLLQLTPCFKESELASPEPNSPLSAASNTSGHVSIQSVRPLLPRLFPLVNHYFYQGGSLVPFRVDTPVPQELPDRSEAVADDNHMSALVSLQWVRTVTTMQANNARFNLHRMQVQAEMQAKGFEWSEAHPDAPNPYFEHLSLLQRLDLQAPDPHTLICVHLHDHSRLILTRHTPALN